MSEKTANEKEIHRKDINGGKLKETHEIIAQTNCSIHKLTIANMNDVNCCTGFNAGLFREIHSNTQWFV